MEFTFSQIIWLIVAVTVSIIAIRFSFTLDINKFLEDRRKISENKARNACTHLYPFYGKNDKILGFKSAFISPAGTTNWICQRCGTIKYSIDENEEKLKIEYYLSHNEEFKKREKKFEKLVKKAGY